MERLPTALFCKLTAVPPPGSEYNVAPHSLIRFAAVLYDPFPTLKTSEASYSAGGSLALL